MNILRKDDSDHGILVLITNLCFLPSKPESNIVELKIYFSWLCLSALSKSTSHQISAPALLRTLTSDAVRIIHSRLDKVLALDKKERKMTKDVHNLMDCRNSRASICAVAHQHSSKSFLLMSSQKAHSHP
mmetsp:Transcript_47291/g.115456  ORF Transcript_47291/g.115456 Transcript_47291/m.115456 type:complete len:130 (+) Transcript_47291:346-735(+)